MEEVKRKRPYDSSGRTARARRSQEAILDEAERQFLAGGYAATTVVAIADAVGVSVETIYKRFGSKSGLVRAIFDRGLAGRGLVPAERRSDQMRAQQTDPRSIMRQWGMLTAEVGSVVTPIRQLIRSASVTDPDMATLLKDSDEERLERMRGHARFLKDRGHLRTAVTVAEATDLLWTCSSVELYELLVLRRGWSHDRFARFVTRLMIASLLPGTDSGDA